MPKKKAAWIIAFLSVTGVAIGAELVAAFDGSASTVPWTDLLIEHVPQEITVTLIAVLAAWLPVHFAARYPRRPGGPLKQSERSKHWTMVAVTGLVALQAAVTDDMVTGDEWTKIGLAVLGALGVYAVPNKGAPPAAPLIAPAPRGRY